MKQPCNYLLAFLAVLLTACTTKPNNTQYVPLPKLEPPIKLTVTQVTNPRFKSLTKQQILHSLAKAQKTIYQHFAIQVEFELLPQQSIKSLFKNISKQIKTVKQTQNINFKDGISQAEFNNIKQSIKTLLMNRPTSLEVLYQYAKPYLINKIQVLSYDTLSKELTNTLASNIMLWRDKKAKDGLPVIDNMPYNEWIWWDAMGYGNLATDLIITNQLVASVENYEMDIHTALRGGINNGTTTFSQTSQFKSYAFVSTYPIINNAPHLQKLRNEKRVSQQDISTYLSLIITHEVGHLLFHYGHPYGKKECIMSPMPLINYKNWLADINIKKCQKGDNKSMQKGSVKLYYQTDLMY